MTAAEKALFQRLATRARSLGPEFARRQMAAYNIIRQSMSEREIAKAISGGSVERLISEILSDRTLDPAVASLRGLVDRSVVDSARSSARDFAKKAVEFDQFNPKVVDAVRNFDTKVISRLKGDIRDTVRQRVEAGLRAGESSSVIARDLRNVIGLAPNQERAVANFRRMLTEGDREALTRSLRNRSFDRTLEKALGSGGTGLRADQVERMTDAYRKRMVSLNAATNAQTITRDSQKLGQRLAVDDAIKNGILDPSRLLKVWVAIDDDRTRPEHAEMDGEEVPYDQPFSNGQMIPGEDDWNCRCIAHYTQATSVESLRERIASSNPFNFGESFPGNLKKFEGIQPDETPDEFQRRRRRERAIARREKKKGLVDPGPDPKPKPEPPPPPTLRNTEQALKELGELEEIAGLPSQPKMLESSNFATMDGSDETRRIFSELNSKFDTMFSASTPTLEIELDSSRLFTSQTTMDKEIIGKYVREGTGAVLPAVVEKNGVYYIVDGNHRIASKMLLGQQRMAVRLIKLADDRPLSATLNLVREQGVKRSVTTLGPHLGEAVTAGRITLAEADRLVEQIGGRWDHERVIRKIARQAGIDIFGGGKLKIDADEFLTLVRREAGTAAPNWRSIVPKTAPPIIITPPKPIAPPPPPVVDPKLRRPGETAEEFDKRRRKERAAARKAKKNGDTGGEKEKAEPKTEPSRKRWTTQELGPELQRLKDETKKELAAVRDALSKKRTRLWNVENEYDNLRMDAQPGMVSPKMEALAAERGAIHAEIRQLEAQLASEYSTQRQKFFDLVGPPKKGRAKITAKVKIKETWQNAGTAQAAKDGVEDFKSMVPEKYLKGQNINIRLEPGGRGHYNFTEAFTGKGVRARDTVVHEMGHWLEHRESSVRHAAEAFLEKRTAGNPTIQLPGYKPGEVYKEDKFYDNYVGKIYANGIFDYLGSSAPSKYGFKYAATEIFSMGLEAMARDPHAFLLRDPEHFELILKLIYGEL